jgi:hypothetical protein
MPTTITTKHYNNHYYRNLAGKMLSELSDKDNRIYTILDMDTMEQAIHTAKQGGLQIPGPARKEKKQIAFDIIKIFKILKDIKDANINDNIALTAEQKTRDSY